MRTAARTTARIIGRYALHGEIASGGMATVHFGRLLGPVGFSRTVAIKRLHAQFAKDPEFVAMFLDEARLAARIQHPNVIPTLDVVASGGQLFLVMEYVQGEALSRLLKRCAADQERVPIPITAAILIGALHGLHAAHEAKDHRGEALGIIHRDVSPQNILVGADGVPRVLDFGVAKAAGRLHTTEEGRVKGKIAYMSPEQVRGATLTRRADIYGAAVVLWETLTGVRLFGGTNEGEILDKVLAAKVRAPSELAGNIAPELDAVVLRALDRDPEKRFATAREFALVLEKAVTPASATVVGEWVSAIASAMLAERAGTIADIESGSPPDLPRGTDLLDELERTSGDELDDLDPIGEPAIDPLPNAADVATVAGPRASPEGASSISVSMQQPERAPRRARAGIAIGAIVTLVLATGIGYARWGRDAPGTGPAAVVVAPSISVASAEPATPIPSAVAVAVASSSVAPAASTPTPVKAPIKAAPKPAKPNCNPPWYIDKDGIKHFKQECTGK